MLRDEVPYVVEASLCVGREVYSVLVVCWEVPDGWEGFDWVLRDLVEG
jgi:hypothetical protein